MSLLAVLAEAAQCMPFGVVCHRRHEAGQFGPFDATPFVVVRGSPDDGDVA